MSQRIEYYDFLRGIAIIMVVGIHTFVSYPIDTTIGYTSAIVRQLLNCAVPIFLALSGLFCGKKLLDSKEKRLNFWKKQIPKVYIPALIWSLPYLMQNAVFENGGVFTCKTSSYALYMRIRYILFHCINNTILFIAPNTSKA